MKELTQIPAWQALDGHYSTVRDVSLHGLFADDDQRFTKYSIQAAGLLLDYSKNHITDTTRQLLVELATQLDVATAIRGLFSGEQLNWTEQQAALHTALRDPDTDRTEITDVLQRMKQLSQAIRSGEFVGYSNKRITDIIHIGVGGSHLGPEFLYSTFVSQQQMIKCHFVSNFELPIVRQLLHSLDPETTLLVVASKSFTTQEVLANAEFIMNWFVVKAGSLQKAQQHWFAATAMPQRAESLSILPNHILPIWSWVGGRFSLWSAMSFAVICAFGFEFFDHLLAGAHAMDMHFRKAPFSDNMPVMLALIGIWYANFFNAETKSVICYSKRLQLLPDYLQQLHMESQGKSFGENDEIVSHKTGAIILGGVGTSSQHSFHQLYFQGKHITPIDFILPACTSNFLDASQQQLVANCIAQSQTLAMGFADTEQFKSLHGNCPNNTIILPEISPFYIGALLALYEHKVFVQSVIWRINAFDQWGVERGKQVAKHVSQQLSSFDESEEVDSSTQGLLQHIQLLWRQMSKADK